MDYKTNSWFTIEKIDNKTFAISEYGHWTQVHSYLYIGDEKAALIDSGLGISNIKSVIDNLTQLPIIVITTHCHWDHIGGHFHFEDIAVHKFEKEVMENGPPIPIEVTRTQHVLRHPFIKPPPRNFKIEEYKRFIGKPTLVLYDFNVINLGNRNLVVIHTPGHSPGHLCVYEEKTGYLATSDILYQGDLLADFPTSNPKELRKSIIKLTELPYDFSKILPGHNKIDIPIDYLYEAREAFDLIKKEGNLRHGTGTHKFEHINIKL